VAKSVLVINCGSSSIKYALISERREDRIYGLAENLGSAEARIKGVTIGGEPQLITSTDLATFEHLTNFEFYDEHF
jgi:acetate kinase